MKIFVAGATGVLGRRLLRTLVERGHAVVGLARSPAGMETVRATGAEPRMADLFDTTELSRAAVGCEVVVHAATAIPVRRRPSARDWVMNDRLRRQGTQALTRCAEIIGARRYVQQSIVWLVTGDGTSRDAEESPTRDHPVLRSALDGEQVARRAREIAGFSLAVLRCGWFYAPDAAHTRMLGAALARRQLPVFGRGDSPIACLHVDDAARAFVVACEGNTDGLWHVTDGARVTAREFLTHFAGLLGAPPPLSIPRWLARLLAGEQAVDFFTTPQPTSNTRFRRDFDWRPEYPSYREGLASVVDCWAAEGYLINKSSAISGSLEGEESDA